MGCAHGLVGPEVQREIRVRIAESRIFNLDDAGEEASSLMGIRSIENVGFDSRWHALKVGVNFEVRFGK